MTRRALLIAILSAPWPALASSADEAKKRDKTPPPKPPNPGKPKKGDGVAPDTDHNRTPHTAGSAAVAQAALRNHATAA